MRSLIAVVLLVVADTINGSPILETRQSGSWTSPPYYPAPRGGWTADWSASYQKASALVSRMTLAEKVNITTATGWQMGRCVGNTGPVYRLGFPSLCAQDGPLGVRNADFITAFPAGITVGATWDEDLMYARAKAIGEEARAKGVHVLLGPSVGPLGRQPAGGRNWEGFGSDPYLQGRGAHQGVKGQQDAGVQACIKHYIANEQEHFRGDGHNPNTISANVDDRTLHEVYLWPFADAVHAGVASVMCSYNSINGSFGCQNSHLLNGVLKDELGFQGYVLADWLAQRSGVPSILAGMDQTQPGDGVSWANGVSLWGPELSRAVLNSSVPMDRLNDAVTRIVAAWYQLKQDQNYPPVSFSAWTKNDYDREFVGANTGAQIRVNTHLDARGNHGEVARAVARDGIVLLKNVDNILPLKASDIIRVFGSDAGPNPQGANSCGDRGCNKGVLGMGWGSGTADYYPDIETPDSAIRAKAGNYQSYLQDSVSSQVTQLASTPNAKCLVFINSNSGESYITVEGHEGDRNNLLSWHNGDQLVRAVADVCSSTVVVIHAVGTIDMEAWIEHKNVKAVLHAHLPGREAGKSLTDVLFGDVSPSGHLPYTIGKKLQDYGSSVQIITSGQGRVNQDFTEKLNTDYRWFDKNGIQPRFEFGFGLSYTQFSFSNGNIAVVKEPTETPPARPPKGSVPTYSTTIPPFSEVQWPSTIRQRISKYVYPYLDSAPQRGNYPYPAGYSTTEKPPPPAGGAQGGNPALWDVIYKVEVTVKNIGSVKGKVVPQLYLEFPSGTQFETPPRQLRGFKKIDLAAGASTTVTFELTRRDLSVWDVVRQNWVIPGAGAKGHVIRVGESSRLLHVTCSTGNGQCSGSGGLKLKKGDNGKTGN